MAGENRIEKKILLRAPRSRVWRAISNAAEFGEWFRAKFEGDFAMNDWFDAVANERVEPRRDVTIRLLNERHETVATWTATRCFPVKITAPDLKSDANEAAIESMEIAHEGLKLMRA